MTDKEKAIQAVAELSEEQVSKVLIFMAGLEAAESIKQLDSEQEQTTPTTT